MSILDVDGEGGFLVALPPILDLPAAAPLKSRLQEALTKGEDIVIDASAVQRVTTPCLQVLASVMKLRGTGGPSARLQNIPEAFAETVRMLGLSQALCIEEE